MSTNRPVNNHEVSMAEGTMLVTKTDLEGKLTYCNDEFISISGYSKDELIGNTSEIFWHSDVPPALIEDLWSTVRQGYPWKGVLKNRCKNGDFFWVEANVTPIYKNFKVSEVMAVRYAPDRQEVSKAEALYRKINTGQATLKPNHRLPGRLDFLASMPFARRLTAAVSGLSVPGAILMYLLITQQQYIASGIAAAFMVLVGVFAYRLIRHLRVVLDQISNALYRLTDGEFRNSIDLDVKGDLGDLLRAMQGMQIKLNFDLDEIQTRARTTNRILDLNGVSN